MNGTHDLAYIAGVFDGEGSIVITTRGVGNRRKLGLHLFVCLVNTDENVLRMVQASLGGNLYKRPRTGIGTKPVYTLQWSAASAAVMLSELYPFLRVKKGKAEVALRFQETFSRKGHTGGLKYRRFVPEDVLEERARLQLELRALGRTTDNQSLPTHLVDRWDTSGDGVAVHRSAEPIISGPIPLETQMTLGGER